MERTSDELVRLVRSVDGRLMVGRLLEGRGAWLCQESPDCLDLAVKRQAFSRAFRATVSTGAVEEVRRQLASWKRPISQATNPGEVRTEGPLP
jgi:predicted RNA-binding protein YlxR (DUF448 family)